MKKRIISLVAFWCLLLCLPVGILAACSPGAQAHPVCDPSTVAGGIECVARAVDKCKGDHACLDRELLVCAEYVVNHCPTLTGSGGAD